MSVVWNWDPTLVMLGNMDIRWYGLMWAVAILVAVFANRSRLSVFIGIVLTTRISVEEEIERIGEISVMYSQAVPPL